MKRTLTVCLLFLLIVGFIALLLPLSIPPVNALPFTDGFESGNFAYWSGTQGTAGETETINTSYVYAGAYVARFYCNGNSSGETAFAYKTLDSEQLDLSTTAYVRVDINLPSNDSRYNLIAIAAGNTRTEIAYARLRTVNVTSWTTRWQLTYLKNTSLTTLTYTGTTPSLGTYYKIKLYAKVNSTAGAVSLALNGVTILSDSGFKSDNYGNITQVRIGEVSSSGATAHTTRFDDVLIMGTDQPTPSTGGTGELLFSTDFSGMTIGTSPYGFPALTKQGLSAGVLGLTSQDKQIPNYFVIDNSSTDTFWIDDTTLPSGSRQYGTIAPASGHNGQRYVIGMKAISGVRNEFNLAHAENWGASNAYYVSVWMFFPTNWTMSTNDYYALADVWTEETQGLEKSEFHIHQYGAGVYDMALEYGYPNGTGIDNKWSINTIPDARPPLGQWFNLKMYVLSSQTAGREMLWINDLLISDTEVDVPRDHPEYYPLPTTASQWSITIAKIYTGSLPAWKFQMWVSDLQIYYNSTIPGDVNADGMVNVLDLNALSKAYGAVLVNPNWNPNADINDDLIINVIDLNILSKNYGKSQ